jgi:signal transduction histidine kinase
MLIIRCWYSAYVGYKIDTTGKTQDQLRRIKYVFWAFFLGNLGAIDFAPDYGIGIYPVGSVNIVIFVSIMAYAIIRHQLLDIEVIVRKTLVFAGLLAFVFGMLILPTLIIQEYLFRGAGVGGRIIGLMISGVIIIFSMRRIEGFLVNVTDKYLFQKKYDYKELLKTFTAEVLTVLELDKLVNLTVDKLADIIKLKSAAVLLFNDEKQQFNVMASQGIKDPSVTLIRPDGIVTFMDETHGYVLISELRQKNISIPDSIQEIIGKLNAELIIPMVLHDEVMGVLSLGKKKSDENYTQDDLDILLPLAKTLAIAISNAELFVELGKTQAEAAQKEKMAVIGTLSAGINHEICNPLGIARGQCEAFLLNMKDGLYKNKSSEELIDKAKDIMTKVIKETDRATAITKKLSGFAKPSKGEAELVNIEKEVEEVFGLVGYELKLDKIEFEKNIQKGIPGLFVDKKQFQEVLFNLIRNAGQAIGEKGKITIIVEESNGIVYIDIKDTGSGIPEDKVKQLFNPFFTTKDPGKGTGLGLFIVRQVVEKNGGKIYLKETKVGEGTTFRLEFPVAVKEEARTTR